jgi:hypothetical protein
VLAMAMGVRSGGYRNLDTPKRPAVAKSFRPGAAARSFREPVT